SGLRLAGDPLVGEVLGALTGVDVAGAARNVAARVDDVIWGEIAREESAIRANPEATRDPLIMGAFGVGARL
ncbi:MAG: DUF4197 family protein, partial [Cypionkella sp.]